MADDITITDLHRDEARRRLPRSAVVDIAQARDELAYALAEQDALRAEIATLTEFRAAPLASIRVLLGEDDGEMDDEALVGSLCAMILTRRGLRANMLEARALAWETAERLADRDETIATLTRERDEARWDAQRWWDRLRLVESSAGRDELSCGFCGGPHPFDTTIPSVRWNAVIRQLGLPDYLCLTCIVRAFALVGESFTAQLWGEMFDGVALEVRVGGRQATDAAAIQEENNALRVQCAQARERDEPAVAAVVRRWVCERFGRDDGFLDAADHVDNIDLDDLVLRIATTAVDGGARRG